MKFHWKVLIWMVAGALVGFGLQKGLGEGAWIGAQWEDTPVEVSGVRVAEVTSGGPADKAGLKPGDLVQFLVQREAGGKVLEIPLANAEALEKLIRSNDYGERFGLRGEGPGELSLKGEIDPASTLSLLVTPIDFIAEVFMALLRMLIVPIVMTSIIGGVAGIGNMKDLRRLGGKTFAYYVATSLLAILVGQVFVTLFKPGVGASLGLEGLETSMVAGDTSFGAFLMRMVPNNIFDSMTSNSAMLGIIFFSILFGIFLSKVEEPHKSRVSGLVESIFEVILKMAEGIMSLLPYGVFCLLARVVAKTGFGVFEPLLFYMLIVVGAILVHALVTLPLILKFVGRMSPIGWAKAMSPALMTAFSTSSSAMTLPVTLESVEKRGRVSQRVTSFTLPLGATVNMDGTALYECIGVIFLAQYYASTGDFDLTFGVQVQVVILALLASIGAAGIPSAGLVMMMTILITLGLPIEGAALLLAVDRPLDMLRTVVNVWSDSCGAAVIARTEGEEGPLNAGVAS